jgi:hypothetical protein
MLSRSTLVAALLIAALPAAAQESGGLRPYNSHNSLATLDQINANRGCPMSSTSVNFGVNKAMGPGSLAQQQMASRSGGGGCRPLVSTQVVGGVNLALGPNSSADQSVAAKGPKGVLATTTFTRGANIAYGAGSSAGQRLLNLTGR